MAYNDGGDGTTTKVLGNIPFLLDSALRMMQSNITKDIHKRFWWLPSEIAEDPRFGSEEMGIFSCMTF